MGKYSNFERKPRDFYQTPKSAVIPLLSHLRPETVFHEPCAGDGALVDVLQSFGHHAGGMTDIEPQRQDIETQNLFDVQHCRGDVFITNPPWATPMLHDIIDHLSNIAPTWLLFYSDWLFTKQSSACIQRCQSIVPVGRVSWMGNGQVGKENCMWALFDKNYFGPAKFYGRIA